MGILHQPHAIVKNMKRVTRLVVLPDYQGIGVGSRFLNAIADMYAKQGYEFTITTSAKNLISKLSKSKQWVMTRMGTAAKPGSGAQKRIKSTHRDNCKTAAFRYDGEGVAAERAERREVVKSQIPRLRHGVFENFDCGFTPDYEGFLDMPVIAGTNTTGDKFIRFCDWRDCPDPENYIAHFYYDDFKFIKAWREPDDYVERLRRFKAVISPDFSMYTDFPMALQILSCYRRQWVGAYWQSLGIDIIPDVIWGEPETYMFCFDGIPKHGTVAVSSVGVKRDRQWNGNGSNLFVDGYNEMMKRLEPETVLFYGEMIEGVTGNIIRIPSFYAQRRQMLNTKKKSKG